MAFITITGIDDGRVDDFRRLADPAFLQAQGLFVAEGRLVVQRVIESGRYRVRSVLVSPAALAALERVLAALDIPILVCPTAAFEGITGYNIHRGCLAIVDRPAELAADRVIRGVRRLVVVEAVANPDNLGGIFRNAAAFGAGAVLLDPASCDPLYRKAIRTSMGATLTVPFARLPSWPGAIDDLRRQGILVAALTPRGDAEPLDAFAGRALAAPVALLLGTEGAGLTDAALSRADARVRIAIEPTVDSLNVAVAAGIALHALRESRR